MISKSYTGKNRANKTYRKFSKPSFVLIVSNSLCFDEDDLFLRVMSFPSLHLILYWAEMGWLSTWLLQIPQAHSQKIFLDYLSLYSSLINKF
jgi:hypothetical protein